MAELLSDKLRKQIEDSGYEDDNAAKFYDYIKGMSDKDLREFIWANRDLLRKDIGGMVKDVPDLNEYVNTRPNFGDTKIDLEKTFNDPDIMNKLDDLNVDQIEYAARMNGMNYRDFVNQMYKQKLEQDRENIAHEGIGGALLSLFGKRQQEAIARGEDPSWKDYAGDIGEQALYMVPWGRAIGGASKLAKLGQVASNAVAPVATEAYDSMVYDENNPRGEFNAGDVAMGTTTNLVAPLGLNAGLNKIGRATGNKAAKETFRELGVGPSREEIAKEFSKKYTPQSYAQGAATRASHGHQLSEGQLEAFAKSRPEDKVNYNSLKKKLANGDKTITKEDAQMILANPELKNYYFVGKAKPELELKAEEAIKNWGTNTFGDKMYSDNKTSLPLVGNKLNKLLEEEKELKKSRKDEEDSKRRMRELYGFEF
jgi:hypothetical protein